MSRRRAAHVQRGVIKIFHYNVDFLFLLFGVCGLNSLFWQKFSLTEHCSKQLSSNTLRKDTELLHS